MRIPREDLERLITVARRLGDLREKVVFLGGAVIGLLLTDPACREVRPTEDVDLLVETVTYARHVSMEEEFRRRTSVLFSEILQPLAGNEGFPRCFTGPLGSGADPWIARCRRPSSDDKHLRPEGGLAAGPWDINTPFEKNGRVPYDVP